MWDAILRAKHSGRSFLESDKREVACKEGICGERNHGAKNKTLIKSYYGVPDQERHQ